MSALRIVLSDWLDAQRKLERLALLSLQNLSAASAPWGQYVHEDWARAVRTQQRECSRCGWTVLMLTRAANDEGNASPERA